jgi:hypothetical protein
MEKFNKYFLLIKAANSGSYSEYHDHLEAIEYSGCEYCLNNQRYIQRTAKVTPKKIGQFVTLWKRNSSGITVPFNAKDNFNYIVIICSQDKKLGRFLFPKNILIQKKIISNIPEDCDGKRGFRVYPKWDMPTSKQAIETQNWQLEYFIENLTL